MSKDSTPIIKVENDAVEKFLQILDKEIGKGGYIIDSKTKRRVMTQEGEEIKKKELGLIVKGSSIFFKRDLFSIIRYLESK